ncbi:MAG TPA: hypothetical protein PLC42_01625 [Parachlamydiaceae bacterium]|nr:hypothetical protein [Parachlamydiaceae bacterium]
MLKDASYKEKFQLLKSWMPGIAETVKKELKNDHLKKDWLFAKKYFPGKNLNKITADELGAGYQTAIAEEEKGEEIAEFISNAWLLKNSELYDYFEKELRKVNEDFSAIEKLAPAESLKIRQEAVNTFGAYRTYLFSVLNSVAFQESDFNHLQEEAKKEFAHAKENEEEALKLKSEGNIEKNYQLQMARMTDKYEKKISGLQKKYMQDQEALKKQITSLQTALNRQNKACQ